MKYTKLEIIEAAKNSGISYSSLRNRIGEGMTLQEAIKHKPRKMGSRDMARGTKHFEWKDHYPNFSVEIANKYHSVVL